MSGFCQQFDRIRRDCVIVCVEEGVSIVAVLVTMYDKRYAAFQQQIDPAVVEHRQSQNKAVERAAADQTLMGCKNVTAVADVQYEIKVMRSELELPPKDRTCSGLRLRADELAR